jgi:hypothetical protein
MEAMRLKMETWRVCRQVIADSHHLDEEQDPDPDPYEVKSWFHIQINVKSWIRIRIKVKSGS